MNREDHFRLLASMALIDGSLHDKELQRLLGLARLVGIREAKARRLLKDVAGATVKKLKVPVRRVERFGVFQDLVLIAAQDGEIDPAERELLDKIAPHFKIGQEELERLLASSLAAMASDERGAPVPPHLEAEGLSPLLRSVFGAKTGEQRLALVATLAMAEDWTADASAAPWTRCAERLGVQPGRAMDVLSEAAAAESPEPVQPREVKDGLRSFGVLVGLNRLRDLVDGELDFLACVGRRLGVGEVLLRRKVFLYVPGAKPSLDA